MVAKDLALALFGVGAVTAGIYLVHTAAESLLHKWRTVRARYKEK